MWLVNHHSVSILAETFGLQRAQVDESREVMADRREGMTHDSVLFRSDPRIVINAILGTKRQVWVVTM